MSNKVITSPVIALPDNARDGDQIAARHKATPQQVAQMIESGEYEFVGYDDYGYARFVPQAQGKK